MLSCRHWGESQLTGKLHSVTSAGSCSGNCVLLPRWCRWGKYQVLLGLTFTLGAIQPKANLHTGNYLQVDPLILTGFHCTARLWPAGQGSTVCEVALLKTFPQEPTAERSGSACPAVCPCLAALFQPFPHSWSCALLDKGKNKSSCPKWKAGGSSWCGFHKCGTALFFRIWGSETEACRIPEESRNPPCSSADGRTETPLFQRQVCQEALLTDSDVCGFTWGWVWSKWLHTDAKRSYICCCLTLQVLPECSGSAREWLIGLSSFTHMTHLRL